MVDCSAPSKDLLLILLEDQDSRRCVMPDTLSLPSALGSLDLAACIREALAEAEAAGNAGEHPIGAVLVIHGTIVSRGHSCAQEQRSRMAHAEMQALLRGGDALWEHYGDALLVTTVEPCPMCLGATVMANVRHIVFALHDHNAGGCQIVDTIPYVQRRIRTYLGGVLEAESCALFERFDPSMLRYIQPDGAPA
jgi:tRNA(adenine34) deaminase